MLQVRKLLQHDRSLLNKYEQKLLDSYIDDNKSVKWCPSVPHCGCAIQASAINQCKDVLCTTHMCDACFYVGVVGKIYLVFIPAALTLLRVLTVAGPQMPGVMPVTCWRCGLCYGAMHCWSNSRQSTVT